MDKGKDKEQIPSVQQQEDTALKTAIRFFADELMPYLGIKGKVRGYAPTETIHLELKRFMQDFNVIMEDGTWKHFEFQSKNEGRNGLRRFRSCEAVASYQYGVEVTTYVLFSGKIRKPMTELKEGVNTYRIIPIIMRDKNADEVIAELQEKVDRGEPVTRKDMIPLVLCLLMDGKTSQKERVSSAFRITRDAEGISVEDIMKIEAVVYVMADKFLDSEEMEEIKEGIRMTRLGQMLVDMGRDEGRTEGRNEGRTEGIEKVNRLSSLLIQEKRYDDLERSTRDREYQQLLFEEFSI